MYHMLGLKQIRGIKNVALKAAKIIRGCRGSTWKSLAKPKSGAAVCNGPRSIYQYSSMAPRLSGKNCKFFKFVLFLNSQERLRYKENNTKYGCLTRKPRSRIRILIYQTWPIINHKGKRICFSRIRNF